MSTEQPQASPPFGTVLTESVRAVQAGLTALQTAEGQELAAGEQVIAAETALGDAQSTKTAAAATSSGAKSELRTALTGLSTAVVDFRDAL